MNAGVGSALAMPHCRGRRLPSAARSATEDYDSAKARLDHVPPERRPHVVSGTPEQMADALRPYLDAGFTGFTFNNSIYRTTDEIAVLGELLRLVSSGVATPA